MADYESCRRCRHHQQVQEMALQALNTTIQLHFKKKHAIGHQKKELHRLFLREIDNSWIK